MKKHNPFVVFMSKPAGRGVRIVFGIGLIAIGFALLADTSRIVVIALGSVFFLSGALNFCGLAPLLREPFFGKSIVS